MSSCGNPTAETDALMTRRMKFDRSRVCVKCKTNNGNIIIRHAVYCRECFTPLQITKFKRTLEPTINPASAATRGPSRNKLKAEGNLAIGFSGGIGSTVLLDLVSRCYISAHDDSADVKLKGGTRHPRKNDIIWKEIRVFYVEVCGAYPEFATHDKTNEVRKVVERYPGYQFFPLRIEDAFDPAWWTRVGGRDLEKEHAIGIDLSNEELPFSSVSTHTSTPLDALRAYLSSLPTATASQTAVANLIRLILLYSSRSASSSHLLLGTTLTNLSIGLISGIATGGGFVVREEAGEQWAPRDATSSIKVVRPLKDTGMKECAAWIWWNSLEVVGKKNAAGGKQGIGGLTKDFIVSLERDYPSTVSTIARTCAKLVPKDAAVERCILCERPAQKGVQEWKARISIRSFESSNTQNHPAERKPSGSPTALLSTPSRSRSLTPHLCYACHTSFTSRSSRSAAHVVKGASADRRNESVPLPAWVASRVLDLGSNGDAAGDGEIWRGLQMTAGEMQATVKDFLLED